MLWLLLAVCNFRVMNLDYVTTRTTMRLWHNLYVAERVSHDFEFLFAPTTHILKFAPTTHSLNDFGAILNDEVHAIARCCRSDPEEGGSSQDCFLVGVAHGPHAQKAASELVRILVLEHDVGVYGDLLSRYQPRWLIAHKFHATSGNMSNVLLRE